MRLAKEDTWNRINAIRSELPANVELTVEQMTPSVFPILSLVLTGGENQAQLRDYAYYQLAPKIKNIHDVLYANVAGGDLREIAVEPRPDDLLAAGLSAADLADQINKAHILQPVGRIEQPPYAFQLIVNTQGEKVRQIEDLVISTQHDQPLRVRDVADVTISHQDRVLSIGFEEKDAVVITVFRRLGGNTVNISRDLNALLDKEGLKLPPGDPNKPPPRNVQATVVYDQAAFVNSAVDNVRDAILIGGVFSILILLVFLQRLWAVLIAVLTAAGGLLLTYGVWVVAVALLQRTGPNGWSQSVHEARDLILVGGAGVAFIVMGIFFWRATLISALAIPTTLAITFLFLHWAGETLNLMSLGGLAVAVGLIIDDTVVVIENIARHLSPSARSGSLPGGVEADPVAAASGEITGAVVGSTLTTVLVFVPLAFIVGVYGQFFASLSWALSIAVLVSMVISLTLVPVFAAKFLAGRPMPEPGPIFRFFSHLYELVLGVALRVPWLTLGLSLAAVAVGVVLYTGIPDRGAVREEGKPPPAPLVRGLQTGLMPAMDEGAFVFDYWAPAGTPLFETEKMAREVEHILSENPDVEAYVRRTGAELGLFATQTNRGDIQVVLRPAEDDPVSLLRKPVRPKFDDPDFQKELKQEGKDAIRRKYRRRPVTKVMEEIEDEVKEHFSEHQLKIDLVQIMQDELGDLSGANKPVEVKLFGPDYLQLRELAEKVGDVLEENGKNRGIREVNSGVQGGGGNPDLMIQVDGPRATHMGLTAQEVERQLRAMYQGQVATQVRESAVRITDVRVRYPDYLRFGVNHFDPDLLLSQRILLPPGASTPAGHANGSAADSLLGPARSVALSDVASVERVRTPDEQWRENQQPVIFVTAELNEEQAGLGAVVADIRGWMGTKVQLPPGYHYEIGGHYVHQQEAFHSLFIVMVVAVLLVYIMLAFQFRSAVLPLLIFLTQPLSLVSGLFALWLTHTPLNVSSYMGAVLLIGLDMKNGILMVEYIQQLRKGGMELRPALLLAGRTRFRPILMTSLAAILGLFPLALGIGPGAQMQQPLAIMVIGGLTANMLFTRMIIPVGYLVWERGVPRVPRWVKYLLWLPGRALRLARPA
jgi:multidrug efflux pump subunit AcrB